LYKVINPQISHQSFATRLYFRIKTSGKGGGSRHCLPITVMELISHIVKPDDQSLVISVMGGVRELLITKLELGNEKLPPILRHYSLLIFSIDFIRTMPYF